MHMIRNVSLVNGQTDRLALPYTSIGIIARQVFEQIDFFLLTLWMYVNSKIRSYYNYNLVIISFCIYDFLQYLPPRAG
jgi:hypothetical protein